MAEQSKYKNAKEQDCYSSGGDYESGGKDYSSGNKNSGRSWADGIFDDALKNVKSDVLKRKLRK